MNERTSRGLALGVVCFLTAAVAVADSGPNHQVRQARPISLGTSGGDANDASKGFCCSGTLGSLVTDGTNQYVLSNNHVLARTNQAAIGEAVNQPGLIDAGCRNNASDYVARLTRFVPINFSRNATNTVDAAMAQVTTGSVDTNGGILDIGQVSDAAFVDPPVGTAVKKSGRTTGLTTGTVTGLNGTFSVQYQMGCGNGKKATATFVNQIVFSDLSDGGDSGSLIVENAASCPRPIALLFAGSSTTTIGNPIGAVLAALGVSMVHGTCPAAAPMSSLEGAGASLQRAIETHGRASARLMQLPGVVGTAVGTDGRGRHVIQVYLENDHPTLRAQVPGRVEDMDTRVIVSGPLVAY